MPITISLLNSLSGVAAAISGLAVADVLLVSVGAIVGASGLLLTQIMCRAMNRKLLDILLGKDDRFPNRRKEIKEKKSQKGSLEIGVKAQRTSSSSPGTEWRSPRPSIW